ncbi:MAG TPA: hypothetical protein VMN39_06310 [Longimicrobiaceae bacterium]|nr:hypothetical protein [Longimicrobiaceae bacterium]
MAPSAGPALLVLYAAKDAAVAALLQRLLGPPVAAVPQGRPSASSSARP